MGKRNWLGYTLTSLGLAVAVFCAGFSGITNAQNSVIQATPEVQHSIINKVGEVPLNVKNSVDLGELDTNKQLTGIKVYFQKTLAQQQDLNQLILDQQNKNSPLYHQWLTPNQYAQRFGSSDEQINEVSQTLSQYGIHVDEISNNKNYIRVSGQVKSFNQMLQTTIHQYQTDGQNHYANSTILTLPQSLVGKVLYVKGMDDFRPVTHIKTKKVSINSIKNFKQNTKKLTPDITFGPGEYALVPGDVSTIYDINSIYQNNISGQSRTIVVVGQTEIESSDITSFRSNTDLPALSLTQTIVPGSGSPVISSSDETEADLDIEWAGSLAYSSNIIYVYTGNNSNYNVIDSLEYAIENKLAPVISMSYGACESSAGQSESVALQDLVQEGVTQGQTLIASSGDSGATACDADSEAQATEGLAVNLPASIPQTTAVGGTEFFGDSAGAPYWSSTNSANGTSALEYIPEMAWNDTAEDGSLAASGGGASLYFAKPSYQSASIPSMPNDGKRDVPDISFSASADHDPYLVCSAGSCVDGFADSNGEITVVGGTSVATPVFASILTLIEQSQNVSGYGEFNTVLYPIAANSTNYATDFHDVTTGNNIMPCGTGTPNCSGGEEGFSAGTGYDQVTGLGSIDVAKFIQTLSGSGGTTTPLSSTTTVTPASATPTVGVSTQYTASVTGSGATPTGTVQFAVNGTNSGSAIALTSGSAVTNITLATTGSNTISAVYSGDTNYNTSTGSVVVNAQVAASGPSPVTINLSLNPTNPIVTDSATLTTQVVSTDGHTPTGTVQFNIDGDNVGSALTLTNATASTTFTFSTKGSHTVTISYSGDTNNDAGTQTSNITVNGLGTVATIVSSDNAPTAGENLTITAYFSSQTGKPQPTGTVQFSVDGGSSTPATIASEKASFTATLSAGTHTIAAVYSGDSVYNSGTSDGTITVASGSGSSSSGGSSSGSSTSSGSSSGGGAVDLLTLSGLGLLAFRKKKKKV